MGLRKAADAVLNQVLTQAYRTLGIAHEFNEHGVQISAYTREHVLLHSDGTKSILANLERRGIDPAKATPRQQSSANFAERRHKLMFALENMRDMWRARSIAGGYPVFEPGDKRLEAGFTLSPSMTATQAVEAGLQMAESRGDRVYDELKLLEMSIKASSYSTPHEAIRQEIARQMQDHELVMSRGALVRPSAVHALDQTHSEEPVTPLAPYSAAIDQIHQVEAACGRPRLLSQVERDGVTSAIAGVSRCTNLYSTSHLSQPVAVAAVQEAARAAGVAVVRFSPLSTPAPASRSVEAALASRTLVATPGAMVVVEHAEAVSSRTRRELESRVGACDARLVNVFGPGHTADSHPTLQMPERALRLAADPVNQLRQDAEQDKQAGNANVVGYKDPAEAEVRVASMALERMTHAEPVVVIAATRESADRLNTTITDGLSNATGVAPKSVRTMKVKPTSDAKSVSSYKVGDTVIIKRTTGTLKRKDLAVIESINDKAGFLKLTVTNGGISKSVTLSLSSQSHHIARVEVSKIPVLPGTVLRSGAAMHTLGLSEGQVVTVKDISDDSKRMSLHGQNGSEHQVSLAGSPLQMTLAMVRTPDELTTLDRTQSQFEKPEVLVHLAADATSKEAGAALAAAYSLSDKAWIHFDQGFLEQRHEPTHEQTLMSPGVVTAMTPSLASRRLVVQESDVGAMSNLQVLLDQFESGPSTQTLNLTLVRKNGSRELHKLRDMAGAMALGKSVNKLLIASVVRSPEKDQIAGAGRSIDRGRGRDR